MVAPVPGNERHPAAADLSDHDRVAGPAVRRLDVDLGRLVEECVEPGPADDADLGAR